MTEFCLVAFVIVWRGSLHWIGLDWTVLDEMGWDGMITLWGTMLLVDNLNGFTIRPSMCLPSVKNLATFNVIYNEVNATAKLAGESTQVTR